MRRLLALGMLTIALLTSALAVNVLVISSGDTSNDNAIAAALTAAGHTVTFVDESSFSIPADTQVIYVPGDPNWCLDDSVQQAIVNWLNAGAGRGLVTTEWIVWCHGRAGYILNNVLPAASGGTYTYPSTLTYTQATPDPLLNAGLPNSFTFSGYYGVMSLTPKPGARVYYTDDYSGNGVVGWELSSGARVISLSAVANYYYSLDSAEFRRLLGNAVTWAAAGRPPCRLEGDVNGDGVVDDADLLIVLLNFGRSCP